MNTLLQALFLFLIPFYSCQTKTPSTHLDSESVREVIPGSYRMDEYLPLLEGKTVGLVVNHTSVIQKTHLIDTLLSRGIEVIKIFTPEHGLRGNADAGEEIKSGIDTQTGLPIVSLYGDNKKPTAEQVSDVDVLVFDIQDVGTRFYTYISTMTYVMETAAEQGKKMLVLDRPNPNGHYVDGPVLQSGYESFVGLHHVPIVYGMSIGEYAQMVAGEKWIKNADNLDLTVILCKNYTHETMYSLPIKPSPNLPNLRSILLYPSLCLFEGTTVSIGRGTDRQFQVVGAPYFTKEDFSFTPHSGPGSKNPKHKDVTCYGYDFTVYSDEELFSKKEISLDYLIEFYKASSGEDYFNSFFKKLAGNDDLQSKIEKGWTAEEIRKSWSHDLNEFKNIRSKYLLYP